LQLTLTLTSERTITKLCLVTPYLAHSRLKRNSALIYGSSWPPAQASRKTFKFSKSLAPRVRIFCGWRISCKVYVLFFWRNKCMYNFNVLDSSWIWTGQTWNIYCYFYRQVQLKKIKTNNQNSTRPNWCARKDITKEKANLAKF
jgi:hypothetical protein